MEENYNQPVDSVPTKVRAAVRDQKTHAIVIQWLTNDEAPLVLLPEDFE